MLGILWTRANGDQFAWPSQKALADTIHISDRQVRRIVKSLESKGFIKIQRTGKKQSNSYELIEEALSSDRTNSPVTSDRTKPVKNAQSDRTELGPVHTKRTLNTKRTEESPTQALVGSIEIGASVDNITLVIREFQKFNPRARLFYKRSDQRDAASALVERYGLQNVIMATRWSFKVSSMPFSRKIQTPVQLEANWHWLSSFIKEQANKEKMSPAPGVMDLRNGKVPKSRPQDGSVTALSSK